MGRTHEVMAEIREALSRHGVKRGQQFGAPFLESVTAIRQAQEE